MHQTKIICTLGPSSCSQTMIFNLIKHGMNVARLNISYNTHKEHQKIINYVRKASKLLGKNCGIMIDLKGPEIRIMKLINNKPLKLKKKSIFTLSMNQNVIGNEKLVAVNYSDLIHHVLINNYILIDDGLIQLKVIKIGETQIECLVLNNGILKENQLVSVPGTNLPLNFLSKKDKKDIAFACENNVDFIGLSWVRNIEDILQVRLWLNTHNKENIKLIVKIETSLALNYINDIIPLSDVIMISRKNLGLSLPLEKVLIEQKNIINICKKYGTCVVISTQMLHSMKYNPKPTIAEISDVTNAVLDGTDSVMLSEETSIGIYPLESLKYICKICKTTEDYIWSDKDKNIKLENNENINTLIIFSMDGSGVQRIRSNFKTMKFKKILVITAKQNNTLMLMNGVTNYYDIDFYNNNYQLNDYFDMALNLAKKLGVTKKEDYVCIVFDGKDKNEKPLGYFINCINISSAK